LNDGLDGSREPFVGIGHEVTERIIRVFYQVHNELGYGFLETVYKEAMLLALLDAGLQVEPELALPVFFRGHAVGVFRADLVVNRKVILELKVAERITKQHEAQLAHYLRSSEVEIGLVLNFGETAGVKRVLFTNDRKRAIPSGAEEKPRGE
jgi:GxxExxY protein